MRRFVPLLITAIIALPLVSLPAAEQPKVAGVTLRPGGELTAQELAVALGASVWKLDVSLPPDTKEVSYRFLQRKQGGESTGMFGIAGIPVTTNGNRRQLVVAIIPVDGDISCSESVRLMLVGPGGDMGKAVVTNPLRGLVIMSSPSPEDVGNGVFNLIGGYEGGNAHAPISKADRIISLQIETR